MRTKYAQVGDRRVKTRFLLLPKWLEGEMRWVEKATWGEKYTSKWPLPSVFNSWEAVQWR